MRTNLSLLFLLVFTNSWAQEILVLGIAQDAGKPQLGCSKECCASWDPRENGSPVSLALLDSASQQWFLFEASPQIRRQLQKLPPEYPALPAGVFITHAHMGHYGGLIQLGREAANTQSIPLYAGQRFCDFIKTNGPWDQLVNLKNIVPNPMPDKGFGLEGTSIWIEALEVPHRDEYSETLGYIIKANNSSLLFVPDIDKWERWELDIDSLIHEVDYALVDATFFDGNELPNRNMNEIPHPFVIESMQGWNHLNAADKAKVYFIHLNHTNPLWNSESAQSKKVEESGFKIARPGMRFPLNF